MSFTTNRSSLRRRFLVGSSLLTLVGFLAIGVEGCETLEDIPANQCGNRITEPDNGELCDGDANADGVIDADDVGHCGPPLTIGACRYICDYQGSPEDQCPPQFGCGLDEICRKPGGLSESPISIGGGGIQKLMRGDFDGDGRNDVVAIGLSTADVHFLTIEGYVERTVTLPNEMGLPAVGDVNGDTLSDIVLAQNRSVGVLLGQEDRSFAPQSYTTMVVAPKTRKMVPLGAYSTDGVILSFSDSDNGDTVIEFVTLNELSGHERKPAAPGPLPGSVEGAIATKAVPIGNMVCGAAAFELTGKQGGLPARLVIGKRCGNDLIDHEDHDLTAGFSPWAGVYHAKADKDGFEYLFYGETNGNAYLKVTKSNNNNFSFPGVDLLELDVGNCLKFPDPAKLASAPLAIGDVNGDTYPDIVDSSGVLLYNPNDPIKFTRLCHAYSYTDPNDMQAIPTSWTNAIIGDFNGDGIDDVMASRVNESFLDLWTWGPGGFNTIPISVGGRVGELVAGDFDGDFISDAAFRFAPPIMNNMSDMKGPSPLFAMFGNPLALPSPPQSLGLLNSVQNIAAGRIKGVNSAGQQDVISDLVVLTAAAEPMGPMPGMDAMPLTLFQGNVTRNFTAPLSLQEKKDLDEPVPLTDEVYGVFISEFGSSVCDSFRDPNRPDEAPVTTPESIVTLGSSGRIWLAGCRLDGTSVAAQQNLLLQAVNSFLFAPVDRPSTTDSLAVFMTNPPFDKCKGGSMSALGLGIVEQQDMSDSFKELPCPLGPIDSGILLPKSNSLDVPFAFVDLDDNGLRDVILTGKEGTKSKIYVFWNGDATDTSGSAIGTTVSTLDFPPEGYKGGSPSGGMGMSEDWNIKDIAGLNIDNDRYKELAILTQGHVYFANLTQKLVLDDPKPEEQPLEAGRPLGLLPYESNFTDIRGGRALLAMDANSDGIDDLVVADIGKLLLYLGTELLK